MAEDEFGDRILPSPSWPGQAARVKMPNRAFDGNDLPRRARRHGMRSRLRKNARLRFRSKIVCSGVFPPPRLLYPANVGAGYFVCHESFHFANFLDYAIYTV